jgi:hypothetical protein
MTASAFTPRAWQVRALAAWAAYDGVVIRAGVGAGKTWVGARIAATGQRPLVVLPASALRQTERMYREEYGVTHARFVSHTKLQRAESATLLDEYRPDVVVLDEAHRLRRVDTNSAARRLDRYLVADPAVRVAVLTASLQSRDVCDWGHLANWALRALSPVPRLRAARERLVERMDADPRVREAFRTVLASCPGVVGASSDAEYPAERVVLRVVRLEPALVLPPTWETPSGYLIESAADAARVEQQLAYGWYYDTDPRPSEAYCAARRTWGGVVRRTIEQGLADTEYQCRALHPVQYAAWVVAASAEGPLAAPVPVRPVPLVLPALPAAQPAIVWARSRALQDDAARLLGCPLFREGALSADGTYLPDYRGPRAVASIDACHAALNLQHFSHNLVLEPPSDPEVWRQLIGRTARQGQAAARVTVDVVVNCEAAARSLRTAVDRALRVLQDTGEGNHLLTLDLTGL